MICPHPLPWATPLTEIRLTESIDASAFFLVRLVLLPGLLETDERSVLMQYFETDDYGVDVDVDNDADNDVDDGDDDDRRKEIWHRNPFDFSLPIGCVLVGDASCKAQRGEREVNGNSSTLNVGVFLNLKCGLDTM
jgi:hypothetical protein